MTLARWLVPLLVVALSLTACLVFATGDVLPHPASKHAQRAPHAAAKLISGIGATSTALGAPALLGRLTICASPVVASIALRPPFVPPRA